MTLDNMTGITKGSYTGMAKVERFCRYQGIMCEYATDWGYCKITGCAKLYGYKIVEADPMEYEPYKGGEEEE